MLERTAAREIRAKRDIHREGDVPEPFVLHSGWAAQYADDPVTGYRRIIGLMLPGERWSARSTYSIVAITDCSIEYTSSRVSPESDLDDPATLQRWLLAFGRHSALSRLAFLIDYLDQKTRALGLSCGSGFELPLTQDHIASICCATNVHINRTIRTMEVQRIVQRSDRRWTILDTDALNAAALT